MAGLTSTTIAGSYERLLILPAGGLNGATLVATTDGDSDTTSALSVATTSIAVGATNLIRLDGSSSGNTYLHEVSADVVQIVAGGVVAFEGDANSRYSMSNNDSGTSNTIFGYAAGASLDAGSNYNVFIGHQVSDATMNDATYNVGIGYQALTDLTDGDMNICIGGVAGENITTGSQNILIGTSAGDGITGADNNVGIGQDALTSASLSSSGTVAIGTSALGALTSGGANIAIGYTALQGHTTGHSNTAIGYEAMSDTDAATVLESDYNTAIGAYSMNGAWTTAVSEHNVAVGAQTMTGAMNGALRNTAVGYKSMNSVVSADFNTALGYESLLDMTDGERNVALGYGAAENTVSGTHNTALGMGALGTTTNALIGTVAVGYNAMGSGAVTTGANYAVAVGRDALAVLTGGAGNTAVGYQALTAVQTGTYNTAVGHQAGDACTGDGNTLLGAIAGGAIIGGDGNTCIGQNAGDVITDGVNNTIVGAGSDPHASGAVNQTVIGYGATGIDNYFAVIGNEDTTRVYAGDDVGAVLYAGSATVQTSDRRIKENIEDCELGLSFINKLKPVTYKKRQPEDYDESLKETLPWHREGKGLRTLNDTEKNKIRFGLIAQDVEAELLDMNIDINNDIVENDTATGQYHLAYSKIIAPLVKAVQELSQQVEELKAKVN